MYENITSVQIDGEKSKEFVVKVESTKVQCLTLFFFAIVMDEIAKNVRAGSVKELLYDGDLVLVGDS